MVFALKFLGVARAALPCFADDLLRLKPEERVHSAESVYVKFSLDLLELLRLVLLAQKRNASFFAGVEEVMESLESFRTKSIRGVAAKFFKYSFGGDSFDSLGVVGPRLVSADERVLQVLTYKEELVNFNDPCYDYLLDLQAAAQGRDTANERIRFHRRLFSRYFLEFFVSKNGIEGLLALLRGPAKAAPQVHALLFAAPPEPRAREKFIRAQYFLCIARLLFDVLSALRKAPPGQDSIAFDSNFLDSPLPAEGPPLRPTRRKVANVVSEGFFDLARACLEFLLSFDREASFAHDIVSAVSLVSLLEALWGEARALPGGDEFARHVEKDLVRAPVGEDFFLGLKVKLLKEYLGNPNFAQKMDAAAVLNSLELYVV